MCRLVNVRDRIVVTLIVDGNLGRREQCIGAEHGRRGIVGSLEKSLRLSMGNNGVAARRLDRNDLAPQVSGKRPAWIRDELARLAESRCAFVDTSQMDEFLAKIPPRNIEGRRHSGALLQIQGLARGSKCSHIVAFIVSIGKVLHVAVDAGLEEPLLVDVQLNQSIKSPMHAGPVVSSRIQVLPVRHYADQELFRTIQTVMLKDGLVRGSIWR